MQGLTQSIAKEFADQNIRVNSICPGIVHTEMWDKLKFEYAKKRNLDPEEVLPYFEKNIPMVKSYRSPNLGYVYSASHGFFYDQGKGDVRSMLKYAGDTCTHVLFADTWNQTKDCRYILNPPWLNSRGHGNQYTGERSDTCRALCVLPP